MVPPCLPPGPTSGLIRPTPTTTASRCTHSTRPPAAKPAGCSSGEGPLCPVSPPLGPEGWAVAHQHQAQTGPQVLWLSWRGGCCLCGARVSCVGQQSRDRAAHGESQDRSGAGGWGPGAWRDGAPGQTAGRARTLAGAVECAGPASSSPPALPWCRGTFYQGYLCTKCGVGAHKECLEVTPPCKISEYNPRPAHRAQASRLVFPP